MGKRSTRRRYRMLNAGLAPQSRPKNDSPSRRHLHQKRDLKAAAQVCGQGWVLLHRKPIGFRTLRLQSVVPQRRIYRRAHFRRLSRVSWNLRWRSPA